MDGHLQKRPVYEAMRHAFGPVSKGISLEDFDSELEGMELAPEAKPKTVLTITIQIQVEIDSDVADIKVKVNPAVG